MDYYISASSFFIILGLIISSLTTVISYLSQEEIKQNFEIDSNKAKCLQSIKLHFDELFHSSFFIEISCYIIAFTALNLFFTQNNYSWTFIISINLVISKKYANNISLKICPILVILSYLIRPFSYLQEKIDNKIYGKPREEALQELNEMVENAREEGSLDAGEYRILKNIMKFSEVFVSDVMTPRTVVFSCEADKTVSEVLSLPEIQMYSRFPIWEGESLDDGVIGYVLSKDVMHNALAGKTNKKLRDISREIHFIPENAELDNVLELFLQKRQHLFLVVDEYGGIEGLITMEDVLETILGVEIVDEQDKFVDLRGVAKQMRDKRVSNILQVVN